MKHFFHIPLRSMWGHPGSLFVVGDGGTILVIHH